MFFYKDIGYGPEGEKNIIEKQLKENNMDIDVENVKAILEMTKNLMIFIKDNCKDEVLEFSLMLREEFYVGGTLPPELMIAKIIITYILKIISSKVIGKIYEKLKKFFKNRAEKKKEEGKIEKEFEIYIKIIDKLENNDKLIEVLNYKKMILKEK